MRASLAEVSTLLSHLVGRYERLTPGPEPGLRGLVLPQVGLGAHQQHGRIRAVVLQLSRPLVPDVLEGGGVGHLEAQDEDVSVGVGERPQPVVALLAGRVPQAEVDRTPVHHQVVVVVVEDGGHVLLGEGVLCVCYEEGRLA